MKKIFSLMLCAMMSLSLVACGGADAAKTSGEAKTEVASNEKPAEDKKEEQAAADYKIGIITGTVSQGEEEYRAAENMKAKYGDMIVTTTYPDNFVKEQETVISQVMTLAADPEVKAIVFVQGIPGASAAIDKVREKRPDMLFVVGVASETPAVIAEKSDVVIQADELGMGTSIAQQAHAMGAKTVVHYSFPRHMAYETLSARRDQLKAECETLGLEYVEATCPDPMGDSGIPGAQQFILEDVPRKVAEYGADTAFFNTNCSMQEPLIKSVIEQGAMLPQQCCPSPYHAYPGALGIEIPEDKKGDVDFIIQEITAKIEEAGATGRLSTWPIPLNMLLIEAGVEYAIDFCEGKTNGSNDPEALKAILTEIVGGEFKFSTYSDLDNFYLILSEYITF